MMVGKRHKVESTVARDNERKIYAGSAGQSGFMHIYHICAYCSFISQLYDAIIVSFSISETYT